MKKFDFENIHRNKKWAFIDGLITGALITYYVYKARQEFKSVPVTTSEDVWRTYEDNVNLSFVKN